MKSLKNPGYFPEFPALSWSASPLQALAGCLHEVIHYEPTPFVDRFKKYFVQLILISDKQDILVLVCQGISLSDIFGHDPDSDLIGLV